MDDVQSVTVFRNWVELAEELPNDEERGKFYHAICQYSLYGQEPELSGMMKHFFSLIKPIIDKSNKRKIAQQKSLQMRLQNKMQTNLQNDLQNDLQNTEELQPPPKSTPAKKKNPVKSFSAMLPDHLQCSDVDVKWKEWENYRRKKGKPISEAAARKQMKMLQDLSREEAIAAIDNSIANDYQGLFPPKKKAAAAPPPRKDYTGI